MKETFFTYYDFMLNTETTIYILLAGVLVFMLGFWFFLNGRDEE
mgnify:CR=1 FL=1